MVLCLRLREKVVCNDVGSESDYCHAEARKHLAEHGTAFEDRVLSPGLCLGPRIAKEGRRLTGHLYDNVNNNTVL